MSVTQLAFTNVPIVPRASFLESLIKSEPVRVVQLLAGVLLMLAAPIIAIPTPPPTGIILFALGLALVLRNSRWARRRYVRYTRRHPRVQRAMNFGLRRKSKRKPAAAETSEAG